MKRYLSLLLIALMMITVLFVSVACKEEPAPEPEPEVVVTKYTVSFVTNGGTPKLDPESIAEGSTITKTKKTVKQDGMVLVGWYTDAEFKTEFVFKSTKVMSDLTLYAKWEDQTVYEHSDPILPAGSVALNKNTFSIPMNWSADANGFSAAKGEGFFDLPAVTYSFSGDRTNVTNVTPELKAAMAKAQATEGFFAETPQNVIFLFSDGWGVTEVNMSREYKGELIMDSLPYATESKTDSYLKYDFGGSNNYTSHKTTDSPAGGTQVLTGYKTRYGYIALDIDGNEVENLIEAAHRKGWKTGNVTNDNIVDATPAVAMIHDTLREHSDVLYYKTVKYALIRNNLDLLMGWDWGTSSYLSSSTWADKIASAELEGIKDARDEYSDLPAMTGSDPIAYFKDQLTTVQKAKLAGFSMYYTLWEEQDPARHNSFQRWTTTGAAELNAYITWLGDGKTGSGLATAIAQLQTDLPNPGESVNKYTSFKALVTSTKDPTFVKPVLGSWSGSSNDYSSTAPCKGYLMNSTYGKNNPSWPEMVAYTIYQLDKEADAAKTGFFCIIENTCTDGWGHSKNYETKVVHMMNEVQCFDEGGAIAIKYVLEHPETLLVVSADHETGAFELGTGWETDITKCASTDGGHSSQRVPLYAFGAGAQNFSAEAIATKFAAHPNAGIEEGGKIHEGWITGALMGELITGEPFGLTVKDGSTAEKTYKGKGFTMGQEDEPFGNPLWNPAAQVWTPAAE